VGGSYESDIETSCSIKVGIFLTSLATIIFSRKTLHQLVYNYENSNNNSSSIDVLNSTARGQGQ
jgi:hypothetical protein